jgi:hypothetical protein
MNTQEGRLAENACLPKTKEEPWLSTTMKQRSGDEWVKNQGYTAELIGRRCKAWCGLGTGE